MSNIGKQLINIPENTEVVISGNHIKISGKIKFKFSISLTSQIDCIHINQICY